MDDLLSERLHLTVPPGFRKPAPLGVVLHTGTLAPMDVETRHGFQLTRPWNAPSSTLWGGRHADHLEQAVEVAAAQGLLSEASAARLRGITDANQG
ncbi:hypothetical protein [Deinococcus planocerae]|uniref:hypothetical protein n=1 Tax=Deinococcus planocerae TaxID=1737569 RepID=UPI0015E13BFD|nr:hypothetical protein [Deinococcus planocerae]